MNAFTLSDKVHQQLRAPLFGKEVDDAIQRLVGTVGVQRGQAKVPGFGKCNGIFHGFVVADFPDQDHIGCLAQGILQRVMPGLGVNPHLAVRDDAVDMVVHILHRVFDGDDMAVAVLVAVPEHAGQRGRLPRTGTADHDHQAALGHHDVLEHRRHAQLVEIGYLGRDGAQHHADALLLHEHIDTKTADTVRADREIAFMRRLEFRMPGGRS